MESPNLEERHINTKSGKISYYKDEPSPGKPFVVFLHGLSANHTTWLLVIKILHENGYNSLALDLRGHGSSDKTRKRSLYKLPVFTDDLKRIIEIERIKKFFLVGYSFGGSIAIDYAIKYPDSLLGLILISANHTNPLRYKGIEFLTPLGYGFLNLLAFLLLWQKRKKYYYYKQGESRDYWHSVWIGLNTMPLAVNFWMLAEMGRLDFKKTIANIKAPTLIIRAQNDPFLSVAEARDIIKTIPKAEIVIPKHPSHFLASRAQEEIAQIILDFVKIHS